MQTLQERFEDKYIPEPNSGCFLWTASCRPNGYGQFVKDTSKTPPRKVDYAHRVSWEIYKGKIPDGLHVLHKCDMPCCVNPDHLFVGTHVENVADAKRKGRMASAKNGLHTGVKLTAEQVMEIRNSGDRGFILAKRYGVKQTHICAIRKGRRRSA